MQDFLPVKVREQFIRALIANAFSAVGIDMVHHEADIFLRKPVKGTSLWYDIPDHFVVAFGGAFLVRRTGPA